MKLNLRRALPLLMAVAVFYSACKKTENKAATGPTDAQVKAIATNLVQSLSGGYGGASIKDGVAANAALTASNPKLKTQAETGCGFFNDNGLSYVYNDGNIKSTTTGNVHYDFICNGSGNKTIGYNVTAIVTTDGKTLGNGPGYAFNFYLNQDYQVRGLNAANSNFSLNGTLKSVIKYDYTHPESHSNVVSTYTFKDLFVNADDNFDVSGGTATLESQGTGSTTSWDYTATLTFLGNHKAKLSFLSKSYLVDLITGAVTPV